MADLEMERFWDERAREDAAFFVDNLVQYGDADMDTFWRRGEAVVEKMREQLGFELGADDEVVEIGCGLGRITRVLASRTKHVWAFDVSSEMLRQAEDHLQGVDNVEWIHGDGTTLKPLPDGAASACFSFVVFQHVPDPAITLGYVREMGRVLRPGGWSAFQISNDPSIHRSRNPGLGTRLKSAIGRGPKGQDHPAWLGSAVDLQDLERTASSAELVIETVEGEGSQFCHVLLRRR